MHCQNDCYRDSESVDSDTPMAEDRSMRLKKALAKIAKEPDYTCTQNVETLMEQHPDEHDYHVWDYLELTWLKAHDAVWQIDCQDHLTDDQRKERRMKCH